MMEDDLRVRFGLLLEAAGIFAEGQDGKISARKRGSVRVWERTKVCDAASC